MVSPKLEPKACWEFEGEILVLHHPTTISVRYQAMGEWSLIYVDNWMNSHDTYKKRILWNPYDFVVAQYPGMIVYQYMYSNY